MFLAAGHPPYSLSLSVQRSFVEGMRVSEASRHHEAASEQMHI
jgi:hypothetical protein